MRTLGTFLLLFISVLCFDVNAQVGVNTNTPNPNAKLDIVGTDGGILVPRMSAAQRATLGGSLAGSDNGLLVYDTDSNRFFYWNGGLSAWNEVNADGDTDSGNEFQDLSSSSSGTNRTINITNGTGTTISVADNDNNSSNELQTLSQSGTNVTLSNGGGTVSVADLDNNPNNELQTLSQTGNNVTLSNGGGTVSVADNDNNSSNELQNLSSSSSGTNRTINISSGTGTTISVADNDNNSSNEIQTLSFSSPNLSISGGNTVDISAIGDNLGNHAATTNLDMNANEVIDIDNIGVGTSSPAWKVDVNLTTGGDGAFVRVKSTNTNGYAGMIIDRLNTADNGYIIHRTNGTSEWYVGEMTANTDYQISRIVGGDGTFAIEHATGDVGIGISNPAQRLHVVGTTRISTLAGTGNRMVIANANGDLSTQSIPVNTDNQNLSSTSSGTNRTINISGGTGTTISVADNDNNSSNELQSLSISGSTISLSGGGGSVTVPSSADNLGNHTATTTINANNQNITNVNLVSTRGVNSYDKLRVWNSSNYTIGMNSAMTLGFLNDYAMTFTMNNDPDRGWVWRDVSDAQSDGAMSLTTGGRLYVKGSSTFAADLGVGITAPGADLHVFRADSDIARIYATGSSQGSGMIYAGQSTAYGGGFVYDGDGTPTLVGGTDRITFFRRNNNADAEVMSYAYNSNTVRITSLAGSGNRMVIANASGDLSTQSIPTGDITGVTAGDGLTGGGTSGTVTLNVVATNGITDNANDIRLGGALIQNTTITQAGFGMNFNLNGAGDLNIQDNGTNIFQVRDDGVGFYGDDFYWRDGSATGTTIMYITDDGDDGRLRINENGITSVDLDANTQFIFNEQGLDRNFRIESDADVFNFFSDAGLNRIGIGESAPKTKLHVEEAAGQTLMLARADATIISGEQLGGIGFDGSDGNVPDDIREASASIIAFATEDHGTGDKGGRLTFWTSPINQDDDTDGFERLRIDQNGTHYVGGDMYWRDQSVTGTNVARIVDDGDDGQFIIYENGATAHLIDGNSTTVFNENSTNKGFRIESDGNANMFILDASADNIGIGALATAAALLDLTPGTKTNGLYSDHNQTAAGSTYGVNIDLDNTYTGVGATYGARIDAYKSGGGGPVYGTFALGRNYMTSGSGNTYGVYAYAYRSSSTPASTTYGIYATQTGSGTTEYAGYFSGNVYTTGSYLPSDAKLKSNVAEYTGALEQIEKLTPRTYEYNTEQYPHFSFPEGSQVGLMADDIKATFPQLVKASHQPELIVPMEDAIDMGVPYEATEEEDMVKIADGLDFDVVNYTGLIPVLVKGMQEQQAIIEQLEQRIQELESK